MTKMKALGNHTVGTNCIKILPFDVIFVLLISCIVCCFNSLLHVKNGSSTDVPPQGIIFTKVPFWNVSTHHYHIIFQNPVWGERQRRLSEESFGLCQTCPCGLLCWVWKILFIFKFCLFLCPILWLFFSGLQETNISHLSPMELFSDCIAETSLWILNNYTATGWIKFLEPYKLQKIMRKISIKFDPIRQKWPIYHIHLPLLIIYEKSYLLLIGRKQVHFHVI